MGVRSSRSILRKGEAQGSVLRPLILAIFKMIYSVVWLALYDNAIGVKAASAYMMSCHSFKMHVIIW